MAQDHRAPGIDQVNVLVAIFVVQVGAFCMVDEAGIAAYAPECTCGAVYAAWNDFAGFLKKPFTVLNHG